MSLRFPLIYILFFLLSLSGFSQKKDSLVFTKNLVTDLFTLFKSGFSTYEVMNGIKPNPKLTKLTRKLNSAIKKNYSWYIDYVAKTPEGEALPYHENLGLTREEYREFLELAKKITSVSTGRVSLIIYLDKESNNFSITFPKEKLINTDKPFSIAIRDSILYYNEIRLYYTGITQVSDDNNGLQSKWLGHSFIYEMPQNLNPADFKDLSKLNYHSCKLTIALLEKSNKVMINFKEKKIENGIRTIDIDMPLVYSNDQRIAVNF